MKSKKKLILEMLIFMFFILILLIVTIIFFIRKSDKVEEKDVNENVIVENNTDLNLTENEVSIESEDNVDNNQIGENLVINKLKNVTKSETYLLMKNCLNKYYNFRVSDISDDETVGQVATNNLLYYLDNEAKEKLNINDENSGSLNTEVDYPDFCIDKILGQLIDKNKKLYIYVVYYRLQVNDDKNTQTVAFVKIDNINQTFSIYPYEYLEKYNYLDLKEDDIIEIDNVVEIKKNDANSFDKYVSEIDDLIYIDEFYDRYKFDLSFDIEHLYNTINDEYKKIHYDTIEQFKSFVDQNKEILVNDELEEYGVAKDKEYSEFIGKGKSGRNYIFDSKNMMDYNVSLDGYTIESIRYKIGYNNALYNVRGRFCIDRIIEAINDKNYKFVYEKLNLAQKSNYYPTYEKFEEFILENFYDKNYYELPNTERSIATLAYQYNVTITNVYKEYETKTLKMTVFLEEDGDFQISIVK